MAHVPTIVMLAFWTPGPWELVALAVIGLLLFGRRLPDVGRSLGRSVVEFRKGIKGIEDEIESETDRPRASSGSRQSLPTDTRAVSTSDPIEPAPRSTRESV
jgi:sec-independent protein translocase protein TatA